MAEGVTFLNPKRRTGGEGKLALADLALESGAGDTADGKVLAGLPVKHINEKAHLRAVHEEQFPHWIYLLKRRFSLLLYGFGGKHALLDAFARRVLIDGGVLTVNGQAPGLTVRQILTRCAAMLRHTSLNHTRGDPEVLMHQLQSARAEPRLYVVLHHIDGPGLRTAEAQGLLAELSACPCIHLVASMDAVNMPLLWDRQASAQFNWAHFDVTSYAPYGHETVLVPSLLLGCKEEQAGKGAAVVLRTLTSAARTIFRLLAEHQLSGGDLDGDDESGGMTFQALFRQCRERFLVANEMALRSHLSEFKDHRLLQARRGLDGAEEHVIPLQASALQQLLVDMEPAA
ncbi:hypothetical protein WJX73_004528 [Symbiochloris irregularis]|uniref:Origin recognition complex subunit 2 n=1 Tax=Symbiochloris irregularis TaxID=706552 RepID=A0AAW1P0A3_9CHLO